MKVQAGTVTALNPDQVDITGPGYHIQIEEIKPGVLLVTGFTDAARSRLVIRPTSKNQITLVEDTGRIMLSELVRPHRHYDAAALDAWVDIAYHNLLTHWRTYEAGSMDLWEWIHDQHPDVWKEFEVWFQAKMLETLDKGDR